MRWGAGLSACAFAGASLVGACNGQENQYDYSEPILVHGAQFFSGPLPGYPPASKDSGAGPGPQIADITVPNSTIYSGEANWSVGGDVSSNGTAVAIRLGTLGTGYWLLPVVQGPDPAMSQVASPDLLWSALIDFNPDDPPGDQFLNIVGIAADGTAGEQTSQGLCVASRLPAVPGPRSFDLNDTSACSGPDGGPAVKGGVPSTSTSADAIFALTWDVDVDLDLHVITPDGLDVSAKSNPFVLPDEDGGTDGAPPSRSIDPSIDRDSIAYCVVDGWREEDLMFPELPASGSTFLLYANLFSACGLPSVTFTMTVYLNEGGQLVQKSKQSGFLTSIYADGNAPGLYVASYTF
jgi:hypothetical protein